MKKVANGLVESRRAFAPVEKAKGGERSNGTEAVSDEYVEMNSWSAGSVLFFVRVDVCLVEGFFLPIEVFSKKE
jgi:hypothetical protein